MLVVLLLHLSGQQVCLFMSELTKIFSGSHLVVSHYLGNVSDFIFVTFSARSDVGEGAIFGDKFLTRLGVESYFICQTGGNIWWHTSEIFVVADLVKRRAALSSKKIILYGSSMGGYAAYHFRDLFDSYFSICIAPQIFVNLSINTRENRWLSDLNSIQGRFIFDELNSAINQSGDLAIFFDPIHVLDSLHVEIHKKNIHAKDDVYFIEVPYSNHDLARLLVNTKVIQKFISSLLSDEGVEWYDVGRVCGKLYEQDAKAFADYFRRNVPSFNDDIYASSSEKLNLFMASGKSLDFEALYMISECLSKVDRHSEALQYMDMSIKEYEEKYKKNSPNYLLLKKENLLKSSP